MEKLAANATLDATQCQKIAAFTFATSLASPVIGLGPEKVKSATDAYLGGLRKAAARHDSLVDMIRQHVQRRAVA